ncbi:dihydrouridine synthase-domain-containing protein [Parachaetomium inaequale]|uniref:tRNA-dihydrouridine(16/17) synthase [NAD(P)(+)] n=1 Tax=Parachaetomium inaequale TaxID=2588326 RepID=A0AAN6SUM8_9PEZI|nr:dihydrouridine synthase-domain-containing protein [Parachaetomium inaequale]
MAADATPAAAAATTNSKPKLHGRAFYESLGSPKYIVAPMVDQSEFAWRMLSRSFLPPSQQSDLLAYSPMFHARLFGESQKYRDQHFQPTKPDSDALFLDGNPAIDRPFFVQFCANEPQALLNAAKLVAPYCDAVDLNLGCPQGIAKKGHYGSFLQENQDLIHRLIKTLHENLDIPVTAKIRILETKEATLKYAQNVLSAGTSILTVHGRLRDQKGHLTGLADWQMIRYLRDNLPPETVLFANGNILQYEDLEKCLAATGADAIMSAEGNLSNPGIFAAPPPKGQEPRGYWRGKDGKGGWRVDEVFRRYLDIIHQYVLGAAPPQRRPLFVPGDSTAWMDEEAATLPGLDGSDGKPKKRRTDAAKENPALLAANFVGMQPHLFHLLRHLVSRHHDVRNALARARLGDMDTYEALYRMVERKVAEGLLEYERTNGKSVEEDVPAAVREHEDDPESSARAVRECKRPWWVVQPIIRPLPKEAMAKGAIQLSKKERKRVAAEMEGREEKGAKRSREGAGDQPAAETAAATESLEKTTSYPSSELVSG